MEHQNISGSGRVTPIFQPQRADLVVGVLLHYQQIKIGVFCPIGTVVVGAVDAVAASQSTVV